MKILSKSTCFLNLDSNLANLALSLSLPLPHSKNRGTPPSPLAIKLIKNCFKSGLLSFEYPRTILIGIGSKFSSFKV